MAIAGQALLNNICDKLQLLARDNEVLRSELVAQREAHEQLRKAAQAITVAMDKNSEIVNSALVTLETQLKTQELYLEGRSEHPIDWQQYHDKAQALLSASDNTPVEMTVDELVKEPAPAEAPVTSPEASSSEPSEHLQATGE